MFFTTSFLQSLIDPITGESHYEGWEVPMAEGAQCVTFGTPPNTFSVPIALVADKYTIEVAWSTAQPLGRLGIGMSHPRTDGIAYVPHAPPVPQFIVGAGSEGSGSAVYDFQFEKYQPPIGSGETYFIDASNEYDVEAGGPVFLWWMFEETFDGVTFWSTFPPGVTQGGSDPAGNRTNGAFMPAVLNGLGDTYTWQISASCKLPYGVGV